MTTRTLQPATLPSQMDHHPDARRILDLAAEHGVPTLEIARWYRALRLPQTRQQLGYPSAITNILDDLGKAWAGRRATLSPRGFVLSKAKPTARPPAKGQTPPQAKTDTNPRPSRTGSQRGGAPKAPKKAQTPAQIQADLARSTQEAAKMGLLLEPERFGVGQAPFQRRIVFHCGPTNSGKTYNCFAALRQAASGVYAGPLRLLALEGWRALGGEAGTARLVTGEERRGPLDAPLVSCTIETLDLHTTVDVAVLDEIQMLADPHRGWAWTQALLSVRAHTVYLAGSIVALPWIQAVLARTGETLEIVEHHRVSPLGIAKRGVDTPEKGDAVVTFSRKSAIDLRNRFLANGSTVALIYGGLPAEVREAEAARFANGQADVLVATDAIGMGLNLPIKRVLFAAFRKFDGIEERALHPEELRQIAGRAGRRGLAEKGIVGAFGTQPPLNWLNESLGVPSAPRTKPRPWWRPMEDLSPTHWWRDLQQRAKALRNPHAPFQGAFDPGLMARAAHLASKGFDLEEALLWMGAPADPDDVATWSIFLQAVQVHLGLQKRLTLPDVPQAARTQSDLEAFDAWARQVTLLRWLDTRWEGTFLDWSELDTLWRTGTQTLARALAQGTPMERACKQCDEPLPTGHRFPICEDCFHG
jgi:ATP-dependent RNA helicase SUPV3L1/SUV3